MNIKLVLATYSKLRQLTDDETALLETLRSFTDAEREQFVEALQPTKTAKTEKPQAERCTYIYDSGLACKGAKRNIVHHNSNHLDYHGFTTKKAVKSPRASSLAGAIAGTAGSKPILCTYEFDGAVCKGAKDDAIHDKGMGYAGYHEFQPVATQVASGG